MTKREINNRLSGYRTQLKRQGPHGARRLELERKIEALLALRAGRRTEADVLARIDELEAWLAPKIDEVYRYLRAASPTPTIGADRRPRRRLTDADRFRTHAIGQGDYVDASTLKPIRTRTGDQARAHDRQRAEEILHRRARSSSHPMLRAIADRLDELDDLRATVDANHDPEVIFGDLPAPGYGTAA